MSTEKKTEPRQMPKGGRKGGTIFPRVSLKDSLGHARKLVAKTHVAPQPEDVIHSGVVGAKGGTGAVKMSSLKQYGLLKGDKAAKFSATDLAKKIAAAPPEDLVSLHREAALKPHVFKLIFATYHGDTVTKAKLRQRAADLKVHPEETETCVDLYVAAMSVAELATVEGDKVTHVSDVHSAVAQEPSAELDSSEPEADAGLEAGTHEEQEPEQPSEEAVQRAALPGRNPPKALITLNVTLDSSLDTEKLEKQLQLLRRYGAL